MGSVSPVAIALAIVSVVAFIGAIIAYFRTSVTIHGYTAVAPDARKIARSLRGEVFRDGDDLVVSGNMERLPAYVRFSHKENTPGMTIRMEMPATFSLTIVPVGSAQGEGRVVLRTGDPQFDGRFSCRTDQPTQARLLMSGRGVTADVQKLCCSTKTFLNLTPGALEISELLMPEQFVARHVTDHLRQMTNISRSLAAIPGAEAVKITPIRRERSMAVRIALAVGIIAAVSSVVTAYRDHSPDVAAMAAESPAPDGIMPADAALIPGVEAWRLAVPQDFDATALAWARDNSVDAGARVEGDFSGQGSGRDVAYVLRRDDGTYRLVLLAGGDNRLDLNYPSIALIARVPKSAFNTIHWVGAPPQQPDGDGLLVAYKPGDASASVVVFVHGERTTSGAPANYQALNF